MDPFANLENGSVDRRPPPTSPLVVLRVLVWMAFATAAAVVIGNEFIRPVNYLEPVWVSLLVLNCKLVPMFLISFALASCFKP